MHMSQNRCACPITTGVLFNFHIAFFILLSIAANYLSQRNAGLTHALRVFSLDTPSYSILWLIVYVSTFTSFILFFSWLHYHFYFSSWILPPIALFRALHRMSIFYVLSKALSLQTTLKYSTLLRMQLAAEIIFLAIVI